MKKLYWPYIVPFLAFMICTYAGMVAPGGVYAMYPIKTVVVAALLWYYRASYQEIRASFSWLAIVTGIVVFLIWIFPEAWYPHITIGEKTYKLFKIGSSEFNPYAAGTGWVLYASIVFRLIGAAVVVPVMEELFWRSFILRWLIREDFISVPLGAFTWFSFLVSVVAFGFEHNHWFVGMLAGMVYNALLYYKKDLFQCIVAHAITNFLLGIYVLMTQQWGFW